MNLGYKKQITILENGFLALLGFLFSMVILISVIQYYSFHEKYFKEQFAKNNISAVTGFSEAELEQVIHQMTGYLSGRENSFNLVLPIDGKESLVFNQRELAHMIDVKVIYILLNKIKTYAIVFLFISLLFLYPRSKKLRSSLRAEKHRRFGVRLSKIFLFSGAFTLILLILLGFMIYSDFSKYFILFHEVFFDNDLWLLNPQTDRLIQMLPEVFFYNISFQMVKLYTIISSILTAIGGVLLYSYKRDEAKV